ncbi:MAG: TerC family protein [Bacteroidetes bacterium]|nr:MAG: TerC family protein [Bacteroidota bacterium]REK00948.1 MAG: TerC family protein [Bacteroidota bacterium]REK34551.1 MAG: TerC family protein [Bacteroidota bacterium]REK51810.1 MAG: TerC family protein [Bacteroidota bacterium]
MDFEQNISDLFTAASLVSLLTLTVLEIVLGIDNIIFISIVAGKLPDPGEQRKARVIGLSLALIMRVLLLFSITWIIGFTKPLFGIGGIEFTGKDLILFAGGLFLLVKATLEIHHKVEGVEEERRVNVKEAVLKVVITQIVLLDVVFAFDSILTAVGLVSNILIMILAVVISMIIMLVFAEAVSNFINKHPTIQVLALSFLLMIGMVLILDAFHVEVPKAYIYTSMAFSMLVEALNMRMRSRKAKRSELKS